MRLQGCRSASLLSRTLPFAGRVDVVKKSSKGNNIRRRIRKKNKQQAETNGIVSSRVGAFFLFSRCYRLMTQDTNADLDLTNVRQSNERMDIKDTTGQLLVSSSSLVTGCPVFSYFPFVFFFFSELILLATKNEAQESWISFLLLSSSYRRMHLIIIINDVQADRKKKKRKKLREKSTNERYCV